MKIKKTKQTFTYFKMEMEDKTYGIKIEMAI
jgi:hypothetical protein